MLEPNDHPAVGPFQTALVGGGIPFNSFAVDDIAGRVRHFGRTGRDFTQKPTQMGPVTTAVLDDTCGNLIQIAGG